MPPLRSSAQPPPFSWTEAFRLRSDRTTPCAPALPLAAALLLTPLLVIGSSCAPPLPSDAEVEAVRDAQSAAALPDGPPNIVVVLVDQLRKDSFDSWAPELNALAAKGWVADEMRSVAPWTYPSVVSLMSGLYPQQHGADGHPESNALTVFDERVPLLQKQLKEQDYSTAAFVTNPFLHVWNRFHEGFDTYDIHFVGNQGAVRRGAGGVPDGRDALDMAQVWMPDRFADSVNASVMQHYATAPPAGPEFTYVHYIDVHGPWEGAPFEGGYQASIRYTDAKIVELYEHFMERYDGDLVFVVTSDHGRSIGQDEKVGDGPRYRVNKKSVHEFNLRIPFVVLPSKRVTEPGVVRAACSNVDVVPTLLEMVGIDAPIPLPGRSLLSDFRGEQELDDSDRALYARHSAFGHQSDCIVWRGQKYMRLYDQGSRKVGARRVFELVEDPTEEHSLGDSFGDAETLLLKAAGNHGQFFPTSYEELSSDVEEKLRALGYLK